MWSITSIMGANGQQVGGIWGGSGTSVGPQGLGTALLDSGAGYVVSCGDPGSLTFVPTGTSNGTTTLLVNGSIQLQVADSGVTITVLDENKVQITSGDSETINMLNDATNIGPIVQLAMSLVSGAPSLWTAWDANQLQFLYAAGLPDCAMDNVNDTVPDAPSGKAQFKDWLETVQFTSNTSLSDEAWESWLSCALCKGLIVGGAAATFVLVAAACIASGGVAGPAVVAVAEFSAVSALAALANLTVAAVARIAVAAFASAGAAAFVGAVLDAICQANGSCGSGFVAPAGIPVRQPLRPAM